MIQEIIMKNIIKSFIFLQILLHALAIRNNYNSSTSVVGTKGSITSSLICLLLFIIFSIQNLLRVVPSIGLQKEKASNPIPKLNSKLSQYVSESIIVPVISGSGTLSASTSADRGRSSCRIRQRFRRRADCSGEK